MLLTKDCGKNNVFLACMMNGANFRALVTQRPSFFCKILCMLQDEDAAADVGHEKPSHSIKSLRSLISFSCTEPFLCALFMLMGKNPLMSFGLESYIKVWRPLFLLLISA